MRILFAYNNPVAVSLAEWLSERGNEVILFSDRLSEKDVVESGAELVISYSYRYLIPKEVIDRIGGNIVNLHISYLPWNRGADPNFWSFWDDTPKGVTIHFIDEGLDRGRIIAQKKLDLDPANETFASSYDKLHAAMRELFTKAWTDYGVWRKNSFVANGVGSYHASADLKKLIGGGVDWSENVGEFLKMHKNTGGVIVYKYADFVTPRLFLGAIREEDARDIARWRSDPEIYRYFLRPSPLSIEEHLRWFCDYLSDGSRVDFLIRERASNKAIGVAGLQNLNGESADVAYMIGEKNEQRKGYGAEAVTAVTRFAFENLPIKSIQAVISSENAASLELIQRVGYSCKYKIYGLSREDLYPAGE